MNYLVIPVVVFAHWLVQKHMHMRIHTHTLTNAGAGNHTLCDISQVEVASSEIICLALKFFTKVSHSIIKEH